ncbi:16436_t:CDS:2 [Racocetra fulgida]|uniref:16436_t:CDS:1 n=1 Tax=Racocetra fulgida TaxID=60492 RepID=A0A9N8W494_9GLOM|nr:16436_t:CDS:2 [Racocetra fulgida]
MLDVTNFHLLSGIGSIDPSMTTNAATSSGTTLTNNNNQINTEPKTTA